MDGDGDMDIVLADWGPGSPMTNAGGPVRLWRNTGEGWTQDDAAIPATAIGFSWDLELVDVDMDWDLDVVGVLQDVPDRAGCTSTTVAAHSPTSPRPRCPAIPPTSTTTSSRPWTSTATATRSWSTINDGPPGPWQDRHVLPQRRRDVHGCDRGLVAGRAEPRLRRQHRRVPGRRVRWRRGLPDRLARWTRPADASTMAAAT